MQRTNQLGNFKPDSVRISSVALSQPELRTKTDSTSQDNPNDTDSFADLARVADRVQTSRCNRQTRLLILNQCMYVPALPLNLELSIENRQHFLK
eukprot:8890743-Pyramimonas_sp.AAC.1